MVNEGLMLRCGCDVFAPRVASRQQAAGRARWGPRKKKARSSSDRACQISWLLGRLSGAAVAGSAVPGLRSEEHTSELQSLMRISYAVFCLKKKKNIKSHKHTKLSYHMYTT